MKNILYVISFLLICSLAAFLRLYALSSIPDSLTIDELAIGYNSYSILKTGRDEYGKLFPLTYKSFGDWKLIGYPLVDTIPIAFIGLNEYSVRLPSAVSGILQVILVSCISYYIFGKKKPVAMVAGTIYAISPWSIYFSRIAYETNLATSLFLIGILSFILYIEKKKNIFILITSVFFSLTLFVYHAYVVFMPIFSLILLLFYFKKVRWNWVTISALLLFLVCVFTILGAIFTTKSFSKFDSLSVFSSKNVIYNRSDIFITDGSREPLILRKIAFNKFIPGIYQAGENYLSSFSPDFLFNKGGEKLMNNLGYFGLFYLADSILLLFGFTYFVRVKGKYSLLILIWLLTAPIASAITTDAPSSTRMLMLLPVLVIIEAYGVYYIFLLSKQARYVKYLFFIYILIFMWNLIYFMDSYFIHVNYQRSLFLHYGYKQAVVVSNKNPNDKVVMTSPNNFPYISFLFYNHYDPKKYINTVKYYPNSGEFTLVKSFGRYSFVDAIDNNNLKPKTLYINNNSKFKIPINLMKSYGYILTPSKQFVFEWYITK